ncbi:hypothetical protein GCM10022285_16230 [Streptomyces tunisiensis]|uniref:Uncharacterized protein n=1 Tax=Streptomyces tunisiensis TaxID=948699 RepID=A0ABP7Y1X6_9ACTN
MPHGGPDRGTGQVTGSVGSGTGSGGTRGGGVPSAVRVRTGRRAPTVRLCIASHCPDNATTGAARGPAQLRTSSWNSKEYREGR